MSKEKKKYTSSDEFAMQSMMRQVAKMIQEQDFQSEEEVTEFLEKALSTRSLDDFDLDDDEEMEALELAYAALEEDDLEEAITLADEALQIDPGCITAYIALGKKIPSTYACIACFEKGKTIGEAQLAAGE